MDGIDKALEGYVTIEEAARMLRKSDKSVRRYIHAGMLDAVISVGTIKLDKYYISLESINKLLAQPVQTEDSLNRHLRQLEEKLAILSMKFEEMKGETTRRFEEAENKLSREIREVREDLSRQSRIEPLSNLPRQKTTPVKPATTSQDDFIIFVSEEAELPTGATSLHALADRLKLQYKSLRDYIVTHKLSHYGIANPARPRETARFVTPEQEEAIIKARSR